jgi:PilZ domain
MAFGKRGGGGRRSAAREAAPLIAVWTTVTNTHSATLIDVSSSGARLHCSRAVPKIGQELVVAIERVRAFGRVMWSDEDQCGVAFDVPLAPEDVEYLRQRGASSAGFTAETKAALDEWTLGVAR